MLKFFKSKKCLKVELENKAWAVEVLTCVPQTTKRQKIFINLEAALGLAQMLIKLTLDVTSKLAVKLQATVDSVSKQ